MTNNEHVCIEFKKLFLSISNCFALCPFVLSSFEWNMPTKIYLVPLKLNADKLERIRYIIELNKDDYCLIASCVIADYIVTGLKSPSRIVRNIRGVSAKAP
jgi:hypothetical protein